MSGYPLFDKFSRLERTLPRLPLGRFPTPVRLTGKAGSIDELWVKDDGQSSLLYGGNKVRKLELILADVRQKGSTRIITAGGLGSHHVLATALFAREQGIRTTGVVVEQPWTPHVQEIIRLNHRSGADLVPVRSRTALALTLLKEYAKSKAAGENPYLLLPGGSTPQASISYVNAALELAAQVRAGECPEPGSIFVAAGSGGTSAGLLLGLCLSGLKTRLHAVQVVEPPSSSRFVVRTLAELTRRRLEKLAGTEVPKISSGELDSRLVFETGYMGREYGDCTPEAMRAAHMAAGWGLKLETTYTGKTLACLLDPAKRFTGRVMFWNTHNGVDLSAEAARVKDGELPENVRTALARMIDRCGQSHPDGRNKD